MLTDLTLLQIDTKDILFICGGAFVDLEKTISERYCSFCFKVISGAISVWLLNLTVTFLHEPDDKIHL
jgi:hypothetical protein